VYAGKTLTATQVQNHYVAGTTGQGATPSPSPSPTPTAASATDWDTFGFDLQRSGYNPNETTISPSNVSSLQQVWVYNVGSTMVHEPVYAYAVNVGGQPTNIIYAGSQYGSTMYAINASTGATVWSDPVASSSYRCGKSTSQFGIGETPTIDRGKNLLYFSDGQNQVHAVDLGTGKEAAGWPLTVADYTPDHNFMHGGLTYNPTTGMLYAVTGSPWDISPRYGRIVAINTAGPNIAGQFFTMSGNSTQGPSGGGIWGPGGGSVDPSNNNVFIATGNADTSGSGAQNATYAEQVLELSSTLGSIVANNYPANIPAINGDDDFDFGATPLIFQPPGCPTLIAAMNKSGMFELYDESSINSGPVQYIAMSVPTDSASFVGVPAYDPATGYVYVGMPSTEGPYVPGLAAFSAGQLHAESNAGVGRELRPRWRRRKPNSTFADLDRQRRRLRQQLYKRHRVRVQRRIGYVAVDRPAVELGQRRHRHRKRDGVCERRRRDDHRLGAGTASANPASARSKESAFVRSEAPFVAERFMVTLGQLFALQDKLKFASSAGVANRTSELGYWSSVAR
jgi:hypothetical protein